MSTEFPEYTATDVPTMEPEPDSSASRKTATERVKARKTPRKTGPKPRALREEDKLQLEGWYQMAGMALMPVNARAATACMECSQAGVDAWFKLAKDNDAVRRGIIALLEGGAWGGVIMAHLPIAMAFMPSEMLDRFGFLANSATDAEGDDT